MGLFRHPESKEHEGSRAISRALSSDFFARTGAEKLPVRFFTPPPGYKFNAHFDTETGEVFFVDGVAWWPDDRIRVYYLHEFCHKFFVPHDARFALLNLALLHRLDTDAAGTGTAWHLNCFSLYDIHDERDQDDFGQVLKFVAEHAPLLAASDMTPEQLAGHIENLYSNIPAEIDATKVKRRIQALNEQVTQEREKHFYYALAGVFAGVLTMIIGPLLT